MLCKLYRSSYHSCLSQPDTWAGLLKPLTSHLVSTLTTPFQETSIISSKDHPAEQMRASRYLYKNGCCPTAFSAVLCIRYLFNQAEEISWGKGLINEIFWDALKWTEVQKREEINEVNWVTVIWGLFFSLAWGLGNNGELGSLWAEIQKYR